MRTKIFTAVKVSSLVLALSFGISYIYAWTAPTVTPPNGNISAPLNAGSTAQTKTGALYISTSAISADTQLGSFGASGSTNGIGYTSFGDGFVGWDYAKAGIALNAHTAGGSTGGIFVKRVDNNHSNVGIGTTDPNTALDVNGDTFVRGNRVEVGALTNGNKYSYIDFRGDDTYSDFGLRLLRDTSGSNASSWLQHRGTGSFGFYNNESAPFDFYTSSAHRMRITSDGNVGIGTTAPAKKLDVQGGSIRTSGNLGTNNYDPNAGYPTGWGGGIHTWDVYSEATIGAGPADGPVKSYLNSSGDGYFGNNITVGGSIKFADGTSQSTAPSASATPTLQSVTNAGGSTTASISVGGLGTTGMVSAGSLSVSGAGLISGNLNVNGGTNFGGAVTVTGSSVNVHGSRPVTYWCASNDHCSGTPILCLVTGGTIGGVADVQWGKASAFSGSSSWYIQTSIGNSKQAATYATCTSGVLMR